MSVIHLSTKLFKINSWTILLLPKSASLKLPSRGMTFVKGTINGFYFETPLEPDGRGSHWFKITKTISDGAKADAGDAVTLDIEPLKDSWPEPNVPDDLKKALSAHSDAKALWNKITPSARWDWIRWINLTREDKTRKRRIEVACSKLKAGTRRPCCFNRNLCSESYVSKNWLLLDPTTN